jgi:hypothetical protein
MEYDGVRWSSLEFVEFVEYAGVRRSTREFFMSSSVLPPPGISVGVGSQNDIERKRKNAGGLAANGNE